jgi:hypothetical protein
MDQSKNHGQEKSGLQSFATARPSKGVATFSIGLSLPARQKIGSNTQYSDYLIAADTGLSRLLQHLA